MFKAETDQP